MYFKRLKELRQDADKTQKDIGEVLHCDFRVYSLYELGKREIPVSFAIQLAQYYHTTTDYIFELSDERKGHK